jgi:penicillin-binding protein 1A
VADVTLLEMVSAYATLANGGTYYPPRVITRIEDRQGNLLADFAPQGREALSASTAYTVVDMMRDVVDGGTGTAHPLEVRAPRARLLAGKTGTTQESADGWFVLMHPDLVVGAWTGFNDRRLTVPHLVVGAGRAQRAPRRGRFLAARSPGRTTPPSASTRGAGSSSRRVRPPGRPPPQPGL